MKKNHILFVCAAAALAFASCQKEGPASEVPETPSTGLEVITATTLSSKTTTLNDVDVLWENGDEIGLFVGGSDHRQHSAIFTTSLDEPGATATFEHSNEYDPGQSATGLYFAVYPANAVTKWASGMDTPSNSRAYVTLPESQTAVAGAWDKLSGILAGFSSTSTFEFKHMMSYVKFTVDASTTPFKKLTIKAKNNENLSGENIGLLYGESSVAYDPGYPSSVYHPTVTLSNPEDAVFTEGTYYLTLLPGTFAQGFSFTFENAEGLTYVIDLDEEVVIGAGQVANMGTIGALVFEEEEDEPSDEPSDEPGDVSVPYVYSENDNKLGVVFWVDELNPAKAKVLSAATVKTTWGTSSATKYTWEADIRSDDGAANHAYVLGLDGSDATTYPAVYFCENLGEGWRMPTISELEQLVLTYYGIEEYDTTTQYYSTTPYSTNAASFDSLLAECLGDQNAKLFPDTSNAWYWTGQTYYKDGDSNSGKIARVKFASTILVSGSNAKNTSNVRCVKEVELQ